MERFSESKPSTQEVSLGYPGKKDSRKTFVDFNDTIVKNIKTYQTMDENPLIEFGKIFNKDASRKHHLGSAQMFISIFEELQKENNLPFAFILLHKYMEMTQIPLEGTTKVETKLDNWKGNSFLRALLGAAQSFIGVADCAWDRNTGFIKEKAEKDAFLIYVGGRSESGKEVKGFIEDLITGYQGVSVKVFGISPGAIEHYASIIGEMAPLLQYVYHKENDSLASDEKIVGAIEIIKSMVSIVYAATKQRNAQSVMDINKEDPEEDPVAQATKNLYESVKGLLSIIQGNEGNLLEKENLSFNETRKANLQKFLQGLKKNLESLGKGESLVNPEFQQKMPTVTIETKGESEKVTKWQNDSWSFRNLLQQYKRERNVDLPVVEEEEITSQNQLN